MHRSIAAVLVVGTLGLGGCTQISDQLDSAQVAEPSGGTSARPILVTRHWGVVDGMLSVVVQNTTDRTLRYAEGVVTARSGEDVLLATSTDATDTGCCGVVDLPPGQQYGFYLDVGSDTADQISRVDVAYRDISWGPASEAADTPSIAARPRGLERNKTGSVVVAELNTDDPVTEVVAQAFVTDRDGQFLAVVSGRWRCLRQGDREIRMQLFHPLPAGAQVDRVVVHRVLDDPTTSAPDCRAATRPL